MPTPFDVDHFRCQGQGLLCAVLVSLGLGAGCAATRTDVQTPRPLRSTSELCWSVADFPVDPQDVSLAWVRPSLVVEPDGDVWLAWNDDAAHVVHRERGVWHRVPVPQPTAPGGSALRDVSLTEGTGGAPLLEGKLNEENGASSVAVAAWRNSTWKWLGTPINSSHARFVHVDDPVLHTSSDGQIFFAGSEEQDARPKGVFVATWSQDSWRFLGGSLDDETKNYYVAPMLATGADQTPWVAWEPVIGGRRFIRVSRWTGEAWQPVGSDSLSELSRGALGRPQLALTSGGGVWLAWASGGDTPAIHLARFDGHDWTAVSTPPSARGASASEVRIVVTPDGQPILAWVQKDAKENVQLEVAEWSGSDWVQRVSGFHRVEGFSEVSAPILSSSGEDLWVAFDEPDRQSTRTRLVHFSPCANGEAPAPLPRESAEADTWPRTVDEAVNRLMEGLDARSKAQLRTMKEEELGQISPMFGMGIRNGFGMWRGNTALLESCGDGRAIHPDNCSSVIIHRLWQRLRAQGL